MQNQIIIIQVHSLFIFALIFNKKAYSDGKKRLEVM